MNFIIAEAGESYTKVKEKLDAEIVKARTNLISEAEQMTFDRYDGLYNRQLVAQFSIGIVSQSCLEVAVSVSVHSGRPRLNSVYSVFS